MGGSMHGYYLSHPINYSMVVLIVDWDLKEGIYTVLKNVDGKINR